MQDFSVCLKELEDEQRRYFESKLADTFIRQPGSISSIRKISLAIVALIQRNLYMVISQIGTNLQIKNEIYDKNYYGHLETDNKDSATPQNICHQIINVLENPAAKLNQVINIHAIFIHRIFDHLPNKSITLTNEAINSKKAELCSLLFPDFLFKQRNRKEIRKDLSLRTTPGINRNRFFQNKLKKTEEHSPALYRFVLTEQSAMNMLFVAGSSGHTGSLLLGAMLYGKLTQEECKEYAFYCALSLIHGGNHSFHEAMMVAHQVGIPYSSDHYEVSIPESIKQMQEFTELCSEFPQFLTENSTRSFSIL